MGKQSKNASSWNLNLMKAKFMIRGFQVIQATRPLENSPNKNGIAMLTTTSIFHPCLKFFTGKVMTVDSYSPPTLTGAGH